MVKQGENLSKAQGARAEEIDEIKLVHNYQANRIQLFFDGKPDQEAISRLKYNGFHLDALLKSLAAKNCQSGCFLLIGEVALSGHFDMLNKVQESYDWFDRSMVFSTKPQNFLRLFYYFATLPCFHH